MYMIQLEKGENGTPHYQGCMYFKHAVQLNTLKQLSKNFIGRFVTLGKKALLYCSKSDTRIDGPWCFGIPDAPIRIPPLKDWQQDLLTIIDQEPDSRTIYWCWENVVMLENHICLHG